MTGPVHPRVCGEQSKKYARATFVTGSSPRVRGTAWIREFSKLIVRFIPACAGNRDQIGSLMCRSAVHPRVCGEQNRTTQRPHQHAGSSPRVRGTVESCAPPAKPNRFIPACAGNRLKLLFLAFCISVHPRVCGEQAARDQRAQLPRRFIPACAGNRFSAAVLDIKVTVHPRVCGEQTARFDCACRNSGSSPRVRGTVVPLLASSPSPAVHPRVCGEQLRKCS